MTTILVALDGAPSSDAVLATAGRVALGNRARLVLFRTADVASAPLDAGVDEQRFAERIHTELLRTLEVQRRTLPATLDCALRVGTGHAADSICAAAIEEKAELIVIGAHGLGPLTGKLGTVAEQVLHRADANVLVVKRQAP